MPIYEFHCKECRDDFKTLRRVDQLEAVACPTCDSRRVMRLMSVTANSAGQSTDAQTCSMPAGAFGGCCGGGCGRVN